MRSRAPSPGWRTARARALLCFVRSTPSKAASFPTKVGEAWACGIPVVVTRGIGDLDAVVEPRGLGVTVGSHDADSHVRAARRLLDLLADQATRDRCRDVAQETLGLSVGVRAYHRVYEALLAPAA